MITVYLIFDLKCLMTGLVTHVYLMNYLALISHQSIPFTYKLLDQTLLEIWNLAKFIRK